MCMREREAGNTHLPGQQGQRQHFIYSVSFMIHRTVCLEPFLFKNNSAVIKKINSNTCLQALKKFMLGTGYTSYSESAATGRQYH